MAITLPTCPVPNEAQPFMRDFGGILTPFLGGPDLAIGRLGTRMGIRYVMPAMDQAEAGQFITRLMRGKTERVIVPWPLFDLDPGTPPAPKIKAVSSGTALSLKGLGAGYQIREGQPLSVGGGDFRWYMHFATGDVTANGLGEAVVGVWPPTRISYAVDCVVGLAPPMIEGLVLPGDELSWSIALDNSVEIPFTVVETK